jgi:hypothetical protein
LLFAALRHAALSDLTRESVLQAMRGYDELGAEEFLSRYGFAPTRLYRLAEHGRQYDSKAIAGVAHGYATGQFLTASDFSGGQQTVVKTLEALGFSFAPTSAEQTRAWLETSKSDYRLGGHTKYDDDPSYPAERLTWQSIRSKIRPIPLPPWKAPAGKTVMWSNIE